MRVHVCFVPRLTGEMTSWLEAEIGRQQWDDLRQLLPDRRNDLPKLLRELAAAEDWEASSDAHMWLETACFPQFNVSESCLAVVPCLLALLADRPHAPVRANAIQALYGILCGEALRGEVEAGNPAVVEECRHLADSGLWLLRSLSGKVDGWEAELLQALLGRLEQARS